MFSPGLLFTDRLIEIGQKVRKRNDNWLSKKGIGYMNDGIITIVNKNPSFALNEWNKICNCLVYVAEEKMPSLIPYTLFKKNKIPTVDLNKSTLIEVPEGNEYHVYFPVSHKNPVVINSKGVVTRGMFVELLDKLEFQFNHIDLCMTFIMSDTTNEIYLFAVRHLRHCMEYDDEKELDVVARSLGVLRPEMFKDIRGSARLKSFAEENTDKNLIIRDCVTGERCEYDPLSKKEHVYLVGGSVRRMILLWQQGKAALAIKQYPHLKNKFDSIQSSILNLIPIAKNAVVKYKGKDKNTVWREMSEESWLASIVYKFYDECDDLTDNDLFDYFRKLKPKQLSKLINMSSDDEPDDSDSEMIEECLLNLGS